MVDCYDFVVSLNGLKFFGIAIVEQEAEPASFDGEEAGYHPPFHSIEYPAASPPTRAADYTKEYMTEGRTHARV